MFRDLARRAETPAAGGRQRARASDKRANLCEKLYGIAFALRERGIAVRWVDGKDNLVPRMD
jgi:hypothetical protein